MSFEHMNQSIFYDDTVIKSFNVCVAFKDRFSSTNGMDWDKTGEVMVNSSFDKTLYIYSVNKSCVTNVLQSKKHGVELVKFTSEGPKHILCSSGKESQNGKFYKIHTNYNLYIIIKLCLVSVRLWDIVENRYVKSFSLNTHLSRGVGIVSHPNRNMMMTNCSDGTVSVYSLDNTTPIMNYTSPGTSVAAFDYDGLIIGKYNGSGSTSKTFSLYDLNKPQSPFKTFDISNVLKRTEEVNSVLFNPNGRLAILGTNFKRLICINTVNGSAIFACCYGDIPASKSTESDICYPAISPDGKYLISGCTDNIGPPAFVAFNPRKAMISSACIKVAWWIPNMKTETQE
ncbi:uncharacterized protein TA16630 [Theileria annulata]|uniref:Uncharacterized protein n=1 Tax=Theileria annulata TaxID=5874 RepID=Q4UIH8_THEAN|nr:uncharacterized protein TA16630 [Theileria annulata]CAI73111.1 hypothetical protein, conserved [Theileria annulata]|eukprot:XP_953789.1 hypothetical protein, conserved [Theileria annulata]